MQIFLSPGQRSVESVSKFRARLFLIFPVLTFENLHLLDCRAYAWGEKGLSGISTPPQCGLRVLIHAQSQEEGDLRFSAVSHYHP